MSFCSRHFAAISGLPWIPNCEGNEGAAATRGWAFRDGSLETAGAYLCHEPWNYAEEADGGEELFVD